MSFSTSDYDYHHDDVDIVDDGANNPGINDNETDVSRSSVSVLSSHCSNVSEDDNVLVFTSQRAYSPVLVCTVPHSVSDQSSLPFVKTGMFISHFLSVCHSPISLCFCASVISGMIDLSVYPLICIC